MPAAQGTLRVSSFPIAQTDPARISANGEVLLANHVCDYLVDIGAEKNQIQPRLATEWSRSQDGLTYTFTLASGVTFHDGSPFGAMDLSTPLYVSLQDRKDLIAQDIATNAFALVRLRTDRPPGNDPRVIQALKLATDCEAIFQLVQQGYGAVGRDTPIGAIFNTHYTEQHSLPARDPQAAKELLAQAGYPNGLDLTLNLPNTLNFPDLAAAIKDQWAGAGINVTVSTLPESAYYGEGRWLEVNLGITGWGHRPYPQFYPEVMLASGAKWNETRFCDPQFDQLVQTAGSTLNEQTRINAYHEIQRSLIERGPLIVPYFFAQYSVISNRFEGFQVKAFSGRSDLRVVRPAQG
jgi:peptide/nickel transport system substrate-binding protein